MIDGVAVISVDEGMANAISLPMQGALNAALDETERAGAPVVLVGRSGILSAGFDLKTLGTGGQPAIDMLNGGIELAIRLLSFPTPVTIACGGHAVAMGVFLLLCGDYRIGVQGQFRYVANEVAIGMTMSLNAGAHAASKRRLRGPVIEAIRNGLLLDRVGWEKQFLSAT
jgi:enoyl-CoA hydratase